MVLEETLESPLDCKGSNQSILKEINPGCSLEGMMLNLKLQYFVHLMQRVDSLEKTFESLLDCKEIQPVHPKGDQSWVLTGRTDVEAETPIVWPLDVKS